MSARNGVPDAWDDDWINAADSKNDPPPPAAKLTKAEKRAQHQQLQKEIWASAESPSRNLWLEAKGAVPLKQEFAPPMTVLSRKPTPQIAKRDAADGLAGLSLQDEDDSEEEARKKRESELEERQRRAKLEREEKVRKYAEARERIMGSSASSSPKAKPDSRDSSQGRSDGRRQRGNASRSNIGSQPTSRQSPARTSAPVIAGTLFDPEDMARRLPRTNDSFPDQTVLRPGEPIRQPRGPDSTGQGGFGANMRGGRTGS